MEKLSEIPIDDIKVAKTHIRVQSVSEKSVKELAGSIKVVGLLVRIIVRPVGKDRYELVDGERRLEAYRLLFGEEGKNWAKIPAIVAEMSAPEAISRQLAINENREDLTPFEKAKGYRLAWETGYFKSYRELASMVGKDQAEVIRSINVFQRFPSEVIKGYESGTLKQAQLQHFYRLRDRQAMRKLYSAVIKDNLNSAQTREVANKLDERWLSGDRELLREIALKASTVKNLLDTEIKIADLVNKSKCTLTYSNLARFKELVLALGGMVKSDDFIITLSQYHKKQGIKKSPRQVSRANA